MTPGEALVAVTLCHAVQLERGLAAALIAMLLVEILFAVFEKKRAWARTILSASALFAAAYRWLGIFMR